MSISFSSFHSERGKDLQSLGNQCRRSFFAATISPLVFFPHFLNIFKYTSCKVEGCREAEKWWPRRLAKARVFPKSLDLLGMLQFSVIYSNLTFIKQKIPGKLLGGGKGLMTIQIQLILLWCHGVKGYN